MRKRKLVIGVALCLAVLGVLAGPLLAQGAALSTVKLPLYVLDSSSQSWDDLCGGWDPQVGWATISTTNANGKLIVEPHLDSGRPNTTFDIYVKINGPDYIGPAVDQLTTNYQGNGNAHVELNIPNGGDTINVQVAVRIVTWPTKPYCYTTPLQAVPLK